jgi:hypothetical protein
MTRDELANKKLTISMSAFLKAFIGEQSVVLRTISVRGMGGDIKGQIRVHYLVESYSIHTHEFEGKTMERIYQAKQYEPQEYVGKKDSLPDIA